MILSSSTELSLTLSRKRRSQIFDICHDVNQNLEDILPSTSYQRRYNDECCVNTSSENDFSFSSSPTRFRRGKTSEALNGKIFQKDDFEIVEPLGEGFFGKVHLVRPLIDSLDLNQELLVMKCLKLTDDPKLASKIKRATAREAEIMYKLQHPNILAFRGLCVERGEKSLWALHILVDYCDGGSLQNLIISHDILFPWTQRLIYARDISNAMAFINSQGYMHRDLTSNNILLQSVPELRYPKVIVADFGLCSKIPGPLDKPEQVGTQEYESPEMLREEKYDEKSDVFSFGIILCQMIARIDADPDKVCRTKDYGVDFDEFAKFCPNDTPKDCLRYAKWCCRDHPIDRPSFKKLYLDFTKLAQKFSR